MSRLQLLRALAAVVSSGLFRGVLARLGRLSDAWLVCLISLLIVCLGAATAYVFDHPEVLAPYVSALGGAVVTPVAP